MSKVIQCEKCNDAKYGEDLYKYDGIIMCRYCIVAAVVETPTTPCEYFAECNDKAKVSEEKLQIKFLESELKLIKRKWRKDKIQLEILEKRTEPKYKINESVYYIIDGRVLKSDIIDISKHKHEGYVYSLRGGGFNYYAEKNLFKTREKAFFEVGVRNGNN